MGTPFATAYANIFIGHFEKGYLFNSVHKTHTYFRYTDNIFLYGNIVANASTTGTVLKSPNY